MNEDQTQSNTPKMPSAQDVVRSFLPDELKKNEIIPDKPQEKIITHSPEALEKNFLQKPIRTYEGDIAEALAKKKTSVATVAIAETKKKEVIRETKAVEEKKEAAAKGPSYLKPIAYGVTSIFLVGIAILGVYFFYKKSSFANRPPEPVKLITFVQSIITPEKQIQVSIDGLSSEKIIQKMYAEYTKASPSKNEILELVLTEKKGEDPVAVSASVFIEKVNLPTPSVLSRALLDRFMLGAYGEIDGKATPFIILTTDFFQNAFAGMLAWEKTMQDDLSLLLNYKVKARIEEDLASTTPSTYFGIQGKFVDKQLNNRDVREFISKSGNLLFLYSFIDKDTIILTTSEAALLVLIDRVEKRTYLR